jgi:hypothetical protein
VEAVHVHCPLSTGPLEVEGDQGGVILLVGQDVGDRDAPTVEWAHPRRHGLEVLDRAPVGTGDRVVAGDVPDHVLGEGLPVGLRVAVANAAYTALTCSTKC